MAREPSTLERRCPSPDRLGEPRLRERRERLEVAIKLALGKLKLPQSCEAGVIASRFDKLPITFRHAEVVATLPHHHSDPFDRTLVAQALSERLTLVTHDRRLAPYAVDLIWI